MAERSIVALFIAEDMAYRGKQAEQLKKIHPIEWKFASNLNEAEALIKTSSEALEVALVESLPDQDTREEEILARLKNLDSKLAIILLHKETPKQNQLAWPEDAFLALDPPYTEAELARCIVAAASQRQKLTLIQSIHEIFSKMNTSLNPPEVFRCLCESAMTLFNADHSGLVEFSDDQTWGQTVEEYPYLGETKTTRYSMIPVQGIPEEERLVYKKEYLHIPDLAECQGLGSVKSHLLSRQIQSLLIMPLIFNNQVIASISLDMISRKREFSEEEIRAFQTFANQAAIVFQNAKTYEKANQQQAEARRQISGMASALTKRHPTDFLQYIADTTLEKDTWRSLILIMNDQGEVVDRAASGFTKPIEKISQIRKGGVSVQVMKTRQARYVEDTLIEDEGLNQNMLRNQVRACVCLPLMADTTQAIGVLWVQYKEPQHFSNNDKERLQSIANYTARVYQKTAQEAQIWNSITRTISEAGNPIDVLSQIAVSMKQLSGATCALLWEYDPEMEKFLEGRMAAEGPGARECQEYFQNNAAESTILHKLLDEKMIAIRDMEAQPAENEAEKELLLASGLRAVLGIRLEADDRPIAALILGYQEPQEFPKEYLKNLNDQVGILGDFLKTSRQLYWTRHASQVFKEIGRVSAEGNLRDTLNTIVEQARELCGGDISTLYVYDGERKKFVYHAVSGAKAASSVLPPHRVGEDSACWRILELPDEEPHRFAEDVRGDAVLEGGFTRLEGVASSVGLKLIFEGKAVGVMFVNYRQRRRFQKDEKEVFDQLRNQAAVAVNNVLLHAKNRRKTEALQSMSDAGRYLNRDLNEEKDINQAYSQVFQETCEHAIRRIGGSPDPSRCISHIMLLEGRQLRFVAASPEDILSNLKDEIGTIDLDSQEKKGLAGEAIATGEMIYAENVKADPWRNIYISYSDQINSQLSIPLRAGGHFFGVLSVEHEDKGAFNDEDVSNLEHLAKQLATAQRNLHRVELFNGLMAISQLDASRESLEDTMKVIVDQVQKSFKCDLVMLYQYDEEEKAITYPVTYAGDSVFKERLTNPGLINASSKVKVDFLAPNSVIAKLLQKPGDYFVQATRDHEILDAGQFVWREGIVSSAALVLRVQQEVVGMLFLNYRKPHEFSEEEKKEIKTYANYAAISLRAAAEYQYLRDINGQISGRTTLAWLTMLRKAFGHKIFNLATNVSFASGGIQKALTGPGVQLSDEAQEKIKGYLSVMGSTAESIKQASIRLPLLLAETGTIQVERVVQKVVDEYQMMTERFPEEYPGIEFHADITQPPLPVRINEEWLRYALEALITNSLQAVGKQGGGVISISLANQEQQYAILRIQDTGPGFPEAIR